MTVTMAVEAGQLQLNAFEPVIAHSLFQSITWMRRAMYTLRVNCVDGITANTERLGAMVGASVGVITALTPFIGYSAAAALAKTALLTGRNVADLVVEAGLMSRDECMKQLSPGAPVGPGDRDRRHPGHPGGRDAPRARRCCALPTGTGTASVREQHSSERTPHV